MSRTSVLKGGRFGALGSRLLFVLLVLFLLPDVVVAQNLSCDIDQGKTRPGEAFNFKAWISRGSCIHHTDGFDACHNTLQLVLDSLDSLHAAEYSAGATVLTLLPTISAALGTPAAEIWILLKALPFGGVIALLLSFGGSMMPAKLEAYQDKTAIVSAIERGRVDQTGAKGEAVASSASSDALERLSRRVGEKVQASESKELSLWKVLSTFSIMIVLLSGVLAGMGIIEYGSVYMTWCTSLWWFHLWYITLTAVGVADSWASLPFNHYAKLYISDMRNDYEVQGGRPFLPNAHSIDSNPSSMNTSLITANLRQLRTLEPGTLTITGSAEPTAARNRLLILISIARDSTPNSNNPATHNTKGGPRTSLYRYCLQIFLRLSAITIYVFATSMFAAVVLLALPMAQMILMLVVGSGILGRVLVGNLVEEVRRQAGFVHVVVRDEKEAAAVVGRVFEDQIRNAGGEGEREGGGRGEGRRVQIEIEGHVFVDGVRVKSRSMWPVRLLGVLARPYDVTRLQQHRVRNGYKPLLERKGVVEEQETVV